MVTMTDASPRQTEEKEDTSAYLILDETGDTIIDSSVLQLERPDTKKDRVRGEESGTSEEVESGEEEDYETVDEDLDQSSSSDSSPMRSRLVPRSSIGDTTPRSSARMRRRGSKRKRRQSFSTPVLPKRAKPSPGTPGKTPGTKRKRNKKKNKKMVIVIDSGSEQEDTSPGLPDISVVEIDDESHSVIVLSDDEVGVCSGSLSTTKKNLQNLQTTNTTAKPPAATAKPLAAMAKPFVATAQPTASSSSTTEKPSPVIVVEDLTGNYISKKTEEPQPKKHFELYRPPGDCSENPTGPRPIIIDGCNVAFGHGRDRFSSKGLKICVDYFKNMGHEVRVFVPQFRKTHVATIDPQLLDAMEKDGTLSYTPSRRADGRLIVSYDDRFIVQYADATGGVIVSRDNYRDLLNENPEYKQTIQKRLLMFTWVGDTIMFPKDPLGRGGPSLQNFLKF